MLPTDVLSIILFKVYSRIKLPVCLSTRIYSIDCYFGSLDLTVVDPSDDGWRIPREGYPGPIGVWSETIRGMFRRVLLFHSIRV